jgi:DnaJ-class molecular chaperone
VSKPDPIEMMLNPEKYGLKECPHCNGYGSSLKDPEGVDRCSVCGGNGLVRVDDRAA